MHLFFSQHINDGLIQLEADESRHLAKVLRLAVGAKVEIIDGKGNRYSCEVIDPNPKKSIVQVLSTFTDHHLYGVSIAAAPTKNINRWEWFLEKATEIGIDAIQPLVTNNSERKVLKMDRQERILVSAMKQSYKTQLPRLKELLKFNTFINQSFEGEKYVAHCYENIERLELNNIHPKGKKALILIGPEGDFTESEVQQAIAAGFKSVSLSKSRLRTETAALVACHTLNLLNA